MSNSKNAKSGCFSTLLRSMLCARSVPTHPSDHIRTDPRKDEKKNVEENAQNPSNNPGIVARLMGLESLPDTTNWLEKGKSPDSVPRSRSVNFMDYLLQNHHESEETKAQHRRIRTSVSFREVPTRNHDQLFVLFLDDDGDDDEKAKIMVNKKLRKSSKAELKQSKEERTKGRKSSRTKRSDEEERRRISKMKNESRTIFPQVYENGDSGSEPKSPLKMIERKEVAGESKLMKRKNKKQPTRKVDCEGSTGSTASSPYSVLDADDFMIHYEMELLNSEYSRFMNSDSQKNSDYKCQYPSLHHIQTSNRAEEVKASGNTDCDDFKKSTKSDYCTELAEKLVRLTEEEIKQWNWVSINVSDCEDLQEICTQVEQKIFNLLLLQLVDDLAKGF